MNNILINTALFIFIIPLSVGIVANIILRKKNSANPKTLLFHSVVDKSSLDQSHIIINKLERLLSYLNQKNHKTVTASQMAELKKEKTDNPEPPISLVFDDGFENFYTNALPLLDQYNIKATVFCVAGYIGSHSSWDIYAPYKQLSKSQLQLIARSGHEIGSHTLTHPDLVLIPDKETMYELSESKKILEDITAKPVSLLSFPFGSWNMRVWNIARECGYEAAIAYRKHRKAVYPLIPATGVYAFDTLEDIIEKIECENRFSNARVRSFIMPHFAKGTPVFKYRKNYNIFRYFS